LKIKHQNQIKITGSKPITSGVIAGLGGLTLAEGSLTNGIDLGLIVAPSDSEKRYKDTFSAINVVTTLKKMIDFEINVEELLNKAKSITSKTDKLLNQSQKPKESDDSLSRIYI
jgi:predicted ATP-grasp superfamily ATP-dependent carboligase